MQNLGKHIDMAELVISIYLEARFHRAEQVPEDRCRSKRNTAALQKETTELGRVLEIFSKGVCMIDEVDLVLHPLRLGIARVG